MDGSVAPMFEFGPFRLNPREQTLTAHGRPVPLTPKAFELLVCLVERQGRLVGKQELLERVWSDTAVEEAVLSVNMSTIRKALGDDPDDHAYIETVPRRGYRFVAPVVTVHDGHAPAATPARVVVWAAAALVALVAAGAFAIRHSRAAATAGHSVAVLPLQSLSADRDQEQFADAMTEMLITDLGQVPSLRVVSRQSVLQYKQSRKPLPEIARELHVEYLAEGTVGRDGQRVRITAQLIQGATDRHVWARSYERELGATFALQADVARSIAREIGIKLAGGPGGRTAGGPIPQPAYEAYLRGSYLLGEGQLTPAVEQFRNAIALHADFAEAYAAIANAYFLPAFYGSLPPREAWPKMRDAAEKAIAIDDTAASAHAALALEKMHYEWDWRGAEREFRRSLQLNPNDCDVRHLYAHYLLTVGEPADSLAEMDRAFEIDPIGNGTAT